MIRIRNDRPINSSRKKKTTRIILVSLGVFLVFAVSFFAYIYATGSKIFDNGSGFSPFFKIIRGEQSDILKEDRVNILFMGRGGDNHPGGLLTDSLMILSIDNKNHRVAMMNIPRDLYVPIKGHGQAKINEAYADGYNDYMAKNCTKKGSNSSCRNNAFIAGANSSRETVSEVFGIPVQYYISADFVGFEKLIDSLGGIDVSVDKAIYDPLYPDDSMQGFTTFSLKAGNQHLDGKTALKYARSRETTSDFDRSRRQQQILVSVKDQALKKGLLTNPVKMLDAINIAGDHLRTDLSPDEIKSLADLFKNIDRSKIVNQVLSTDSGGPLVSDSSSGTYYITTRKNNFDELKAIAKNIFDQEGQKEEKAKIEILNGSKTTGSGGKLSTALADAGYTVVSVSQSKEAYKSTVIYDYSNGAMPETVKFLKEGLSADVVKKSDPSKKVDISVVIGDDYKGLNIKK